MATHESSAATGGDSLPLPNNLHSASGSGPGAGPRLINMANGLKKRFSRDTAAPSQAGSHPQASNWWKIRLFRGMINDVRRRAPYYWSDWVDAWDYRVIPATVYMYFAKYEYPHHQLLSLCGRRDHIYVHCSSQRSRPDAACTPEESRQAHGLFFPIAIIQKVAKTLADRTIVSFPRWPSRWICSLEHTQTTASTRFSFPPSLAPSSSPSSPVSPL